MWSSSKQCRLGMEFYQLVLDPGIVMFKSPLTSVALIGMQYQSLAVEWYEHYGFLFLGVKRGYAILEYL